MDIIFFAVLAFFIFFKLSKQLGKIDEEEKKQIESRLAQMRAVQEKIIEQVKDERAKSEKLVGEKSSLGINKEEESVLAALDEDTKENLITILQRCELTAGFFLSGAKSAFEMVLKAFSSEDVEVLKSLLAANIFSGFESAINQRKLAEKSLTTNLISIDEAKILSTAMSESTAFITVKFISKQINYITDKEHNIAVGSKDEISKVTDIWTFSKDVNSPNPNWIISATNSN